MALFSFLALPLPQTACAAEAPGEIPVVSEEQEQPPDADPGAQEQTSDTHDDADNEEHEPESMLDRHKDFMDSQVQLASQWFDDFFADPDYDADAADTQFRLRPEYYYRDEQGSKLKMKVHAKIGLPNLGHRVTLIAGADEDEDHFGEADADSNDYKVAGLQLFLADSPKWNTSIVAGFRFGEAAVFVGPRFRYVSPITDTTSFRFTQTIRWQTNNHWDIGSRGDLNFLLNERFFFRQTVYVRWRDKKHDEEGLRTRVSSVLSQLLSPTSGLQYDFSTIFHTEPDVHVDKYTLSSRYRQRTRREWLYYEIAPQVSFEDQFGFKANPGIRLLLEIYYGEQRSPPVLGARRTRFHGAPIGSKITDTECGLSEPVAVTGQQPQYCTVDAKCSPPVWASRQFCWLGWSCPGEKVGKGICCCLSPGRGFSALPGSAPGRLAQSGVRGNNDVSR